MRRPTYSAVTNMCVLLGVVSAFGFDRSGGLVWLALGAVAGCVAVAAYFGRHWQPAKKSVQHERPSVSYKKAHERTSVARSETAMGSHGVFAGVSFNEIMALNRRVAAVYTLSQLPDPDPAELALKIVKRLQASERPTEVVISGDGSITLKFKKNEERRRLH